MNITTENIYRGILYTFIIPFSIALTACSNNTEPVLLNESDVKILSDPNVIPVVYEIPKSIFRGVLWPGDENENFKIWSIIWEEEKYHNIPAPKEFIDYKVVTEQWNIRIVKKVGDVRVYRIEKNDKSKSMELELPIGKREYSFSVFENDSKNELLIFMDISEFIKDKGLFGYVMIQ